MSNAINARGDHNVIALNLRASLESAELARLARRSGLTPKEVEKVLYMMVYGPPEDRDFFVGWVNREHVEAMRREKDRSDARTRAIEAARERAERDEMRT